MNVSPLARNLMKFKFEDKIEEIDREIFKRRNKWQLKAIAWMDFDDVSQILRIHIFKKWKMWDQTRELAPWLNRVISNQIRNLIRNNYSNFSRPCLRCPANQGDDLCSIHYKQGPDCPLYSKWEKTKRRAHDVKLPVTIENHTKEVYDMPHGNPDLEKIARQVHIHMEKLLRPIEWKIYRGLYIDHKSEEQVAKLMGYRTSEKGRVCGYKRIRQIKKIIIKKIRDLIKKDEIEFHY